MRLCRFRAETVTAAGGGASHPSAYTERAVQEVLSVSNDVAAELATVGDGVLDALRERLRITLQLRGNRLTIEGDDPNVVQARAVVDELAELVEGGHEIGPGTVDAVLSALDQAEDLRDVFEDVVWRHRGKKISPKTVNAGCDCLRKSHTAALDVRSESGTMSLCGSRHCSSGDP